MPEWYTFEFIRRSRSLQYQKSSNKSEDVYDFLEFSLNFIFQNRPTAIAQFLFTFLARLLLLFFTRNCCKSAKKKLVKTKCVKYYWRKWVVIGVQFRKRGQEKRKWRLQDENGILIIEKIFKKNDKIEITLPFNGKSGSTFSLWFLFLLSITQFPFAVKYGYSGKIQISPENP